MTLRYLPPDDYPVSDTIDCSITPFDESWITTFLCYQLTATNQLAIERYWSAC